MFLLPFLKHFDELEEWEWTASDFLEETNNLTPERKPWQFQITMQHAYNWNLGNNAVSMTIEGIPADTNNDM